LCERNTRIGVAGVTVDGVGEIALPILKRRVWQLEPDQFQLENPKWQLFIRDVVNSVTSEFGIQQKVTADLYKPLVYEKYRFFVPRRDTEKAHRMFATLVICLPSKHKGGELIVSHADQRRASQGAI